MTAATTHALPEGYAARPLEPGDAHAVYEVMAAVQRAEIGRVDIEPADIVGDWARPSFDVSRQTVGVLAGDTLVGYAEAAGDRGDAAVHPDHQGRGIGTGLAQEMQRLAREQGRSVVGMPVPEGGTGDRLLESLGYRKRWTSWVLMLPEGAQVVERPLPEGYAVREADPAEYADVHDVLEDAFLEWSVRERESYADFLAELTERPGYAPWQVRVVTDPAGAVAGVAIVLLADFEDGRAEAWVSRLAVRRDQRHRGLAQALLVDAFAVGRAHGALRSGLSTDSRTGALDLYLKVGMEVTDTWVNRAIDL